MADQTEVEATYNYMDEYWRLSVGEHADITCALYDGDYSLTLEEAQTAKHNYILEQIDFEPGFRVLDIGCGWGGFLCSVRDHGGTGVGLTLSRRQASACHRAGIEVEVRDWKEAGSTHNGQFDAVVSVGAFEHFCSEREYIQGEQERIYRDFFAYCHAAMAPHRRRMYLQTMTWGDSVPNPDDITLGAPRGSDYYLLGSVRKFYPGSWLPAGVEQIAHAASPYFRVVAVKNGRLDYIQTMSEWGKRLEGLSWRKLWAGLKTSRYFVVDRDFRYRLEALRGSYNTECFKRRIMDHVRLVLEK